MRSSDVTRRYAWLVLRGPIAILFSIGLLSPVNADTLYSIQNLGSLGAGNAMPTGINSSGIAVGFTTDSGGNSIPVTFDGQTNSLPGIGQANAINSAGTIVGTSYSNNAPFVTEWSNGQPTNLGIPGYATAINDAGQIAGGMLTTSGELHAFVWSGGNLVDLGSLAAATWSSGYGINSLGQVVGTTMAGGRSSAFVFNGDTLYPVAGSLGGASSYGMAMNNSAVVVGSAQNAQGYLNAFESTDQGMMNLGTLGGSQSAAYAINDAGTVVGYSLLAGNTTTHAFAYLGGVLIDLNTLLADGSGWTIEAAYAINNSGDIVGVGNFNDQLYAIELLPTVSVDSPAALFEHAPTQIVAAPEPTGVLLTGAGLLLMTGLLWFANNRSDRKQLTRIEISANNQMHVGHASASVSVGSPLCSGHQAIALENASLRLQLRAFQRTRKRPVLTAPDRLFWCALAKFWSGWRDALIIVQPETVLRWQRERFRRF